MTTKPNDDVAEALASADCFGCYPKTHGGRAAKILAAEVRRLQAALRAKPSDRGREAVSVYDDPTEGCPNCVSEWKCNGPHVPAWQAASVEPLFWCDPRDVEAIKQRGDCDDLFVIDQRTETETMPLYAHPPERQDADPAFDKMIADMTCEHGVCSIVENCRQCLGLPPPAATVTPEETKA